MSTRLIAVKGAFLAWRQRLGRSLLTPVDNSFLILFRIALGTLLAISMERFVAYGWIQKLLTSPSFHFKYYGFHWVEPLPYEQLLLLFQVLVALGIAVAVGFCFRLSAFLLALGVSYIQLIDVSTYLNHYYFAALLIWILAFSPAHRALSVDAWLAQRWARWRGREMPAAPQFVPRGVLWLLRAQVGLVYVGAGLAKLQPDWLLYAQPLRIWLGANTDVPLLGPLFTLPGAPLLMSWLGFLFDTTIVFWLSWRRTRPYAYLVVLVFHTLTRLLFNIGMFPWIMSACALMFFPPDFARRVLHKLASLTGERGPLVMPDVRDVPVFSASVGRRAAIAVAMTYLAFQLVLPFRYLAYGGNVLWHEQGMRFSWRVMVRAKGGLVSFLVKSPARHKTLEVDPGPYLTSFQENEMVGQPDLILQMAHHIGREYEARGYGHVQVFADAKSSLNGRRPAPLIDPNIDLMQVRDSLAPASWILPAPVGPPPLIRPVL